MIRRLLTRLLLVISIAFCGYNWLQVRALQAQVSDLQARLAAPERRSEAGSPWLEQADKHVRLAQAAWKRSDWQTASLEVEQGIADLKKDAQSPETRRSVDALQVQMSQIQQKVNSLWRAARSETGHLAP